MAMSRRERLRYALNHQEPDRVPIDIGGYVNGINEVAYRRLLRRLGLELEVRTFLNMQRLSILDDPILERLHVDTCYLFCNRWPYSHVARVFPDGTWADEFGVVRRNTEVSSENIAPPLAKVSTPQELEEYRWPVPDDPERFRGLRERARRLYQETDYALIAPHLGSLFYIPYELRGFANLMMDLGNDLAFVERLTDLALDWCKRFFRAYLAEVGEFVEVAWIGDDYAIEQGPLMSPELFRAIYKPRLRELVRYIKSLFPGKMCNHCDGALWWIFQDFVDSGIDLIHPVQASAKGMNDSYAIKRAYGDALSFHGGNDNTGAFTRSLKEVVEDAKMRLRAFGPGGGYLFSAGHIVAPEVPPENVLAHFDTALALGRYPLDLDALRPEEEGGMAWQEVLSAAAKVTG